MNKIGNIVLWVSFAITLVVAGMFFFGGTYEATTSTGGIMETPNATDTLLYWTYALIILGVAALVIFALKTLATMFQSDPKAAIRSIGGVAAFVILMVVCYFASGETEFSRVVNGEVESFTANEMKMIDMWLYSIYALIGGTIVLVIGFGIKKLFN